MNLKIISLKHQLQGNLVSIIWKLFFRFVVLQQGFIVHLEKRMCLKFDIGQPFLHQ